MLTHILHSVGKHAGRRSCTRYLSTQNTGYGATGRRVQGDDACVDLRSDTVTTPTIEMREAMYHAVVGDNVMEEDPTVKEIELYASEMFEKDAALFLPTATMANLSAIMAHCERRGSEMIVGNKQHIYLYEQGGCAALAGVHPWVLPNLPDGTLDIEEIESSIRVDDVHLPITRMVALENTHNSCGGVPLPPEYIDDVGAVTQRHGLRLHIDGARIFNATTALGVSPARMCRAADSVTICLSKGLGAPAGSLVIGEKKFIDRCRRARKALGGGMRQSGVLAAAGLVGLRSMTNGRLQDDHTRARTLALRLSETPGISFRSAVEDAVQTNILFFSVANKMGQEVADRLQSQHNVLVTNYDNTIMRAVLHHQISDSDVEHAARAFESVMTEITPI